MGSSGYVACRGVSSLGFVRLEAERREPAVLEVRVGGASIFVSHGFDPELLRCVVEALSVGREA